MCTIMVTIRSVLWSVMTIAGTLMILVSLFTNRWLQGPTETSLEGLGNQVSNLFGKVQKTVEDGHVNLDTLVGNRLGLFPDCKAPSGRLLFEGECVPDWKTLMNKLFEMEDETYPHAWKGAVLAFGIGLGLMVLTVLLSLITPCLRSCICCSIFTVCGSLQSFAAILFTLGCVAYPAGWGSKIVRDQYCGQDAHPFMLGNCAIGGAYWMAVAGTICTALASSLAIFAYKSTKSQKAQIRRQEGDTFICVP